MSRQGGDERLTGGWAIKNLLLDLHYALRLMRKDASLTATIVAILALGIGATVAIFSTMNSVLLRPLPYADPDRLVALATNLPGMGTHQALSSAAEYLHLRENSRTLSGVAGFSSPGSYNLSGVEDPERIQAILVTENFFSVMGVPPQLGRTHQPQDENPGVTTLAVISHSLWTRRFGADPEIIGQTVRLDANPFTIIGVMPASFRHPTPLASLNVEIWVAAGFTGTPFAPPSRENRNMWLLGRLAPQSSLEDARVEMKVLAHDLQAQYPERYPPDSGFNLDVRSLRERISGNFRPIFAMALVTVTFVLLIACTNVANLLLSRSNVRPREMAIRATLGASRQRLCRQLLTESLVLSLLGSALGLAIAWWFAKFLSGLGQLYVPGIADVQIDWHVLAFTLAVSVITAMLFGLAPSLHISKPQFSEILNDSSKGSTAGVRHRKASALLIVVEFALAFVLLIGAGLLLNSYWKVHKIDPGFNADHLLTMQIALSTGPGARYGTPQQRADFYRQLIERLQAVPGVTSAGVVTALPMSASTLPTQPRNYPVVTIRDRELRNPNDVAKAEWHLVSSGYFRTMGIPLMRGRGITEQDDMKAPPCVVINQALAERYLPNEDALGKYLMIGENDSSDAPWMEVIGIVRNFKNERLESQPVPEMYVPYYQLPEHAMSLVVRTQGEPASMAAAVISTVRVMDPDQPVFQVRTMETILASSLGILKFTAVILGIFALVALVLAAIGIYGVVSYSVAQRTHEIGIRMAVGAQQRQILKLVLNNGGRLVMIGTLIGALTAALAASTVTRFIPGLSDGVAAVDLITLLIVAAILIGIGLTATCIPALRATRVDPLVTLRSD